MRIERLRVGRRASRPIASRADRPVSGNRKTGSPTIPDRRSACPSDRLARRAQSSRPPSASRRCPRVRDRRGRAVRCNSTARAGSDSQYSIDVAERLDRVLDLFGKIDGRRAFLARLQIGGERLAALFDQARKIMREALDIDASGRRRRPVCPASCSWPAQSPACARQRASSSCKVTAKRQRLKNRLSAAAMDVNRPFFDPCFGHTLAVYARKYLHEITSHHAAVPNTCVQTAGPAAGERWLWRRHCWRFRCCPAAPPPRSTAFRKEIGGLPDSAPKRGRRCRRPIPRCMTCRRPAPPRCWTQEQQKRLEADLIAARNRQPGQEKNRIRTHRRRPRRRPRRRSQGTRKDKAETQPAAATSRRRQAQAASPRRRCPGQSGRRRAPPWPVPARQPTGVSTPRDKS